MVRAWLVDVVAPYYVSAPYGHVTFPREIRFAKSETGFFSSELTLEYLRYFNRYSFERSESFKALDYTLEE